MKIEEIKEAESEQEDLIDRYIKVIGSKLTKKGALKDVSSEFAACQSDQARAEFVLGLAEVTDTVKLTPPPPENEKSADRSATFKSEGNEKFKRKHDAEALALYSKSISYAPVQSPELALAYANRSAVLFRLQRHDHCLADIRRALDGHYPTELRYKLLDRKAKCLRALKRYHEAGEVYAHLVAALEQANLAEDKLAEWKRGVEKAMASWATFCMKGKPVADPVKEPSTKEKTAPRLGANAHAHFPSLSRHCDVTYQDGKGRFISAVEDVSAGEVLMVEKPFASVLLPAQYGAHCHVCMTRCDVMVTCSRCVLAQYCSEKCRDIAEASLHKHECSVLPAVHSSGLGKFGHLALRAVTARGRDFFSHFRQQQQKAPECTDNRLRGRDPTDNQYKADDYNAIYHLVTHSRDRKPGDLFRRAVGSVYLTKCLQQAGWFGDYGDVTLVTYVCGLLLSHLQSFPCNAHEISELQLDKEFVAESLSVEIGAGIYSTLSLFNHSCDPMATRHFYGDTCVVRAIRPGRRGAEISDNYGTVFAVQNKEERQSKVGPQYHFTCSCLACEDNWPLYLEIPYENPVFICSECSRELPTPIPSTCPHCSVAIDPNRKRQQFVLATEKYHNGLKKLLLCDVTEATRYFNQALGLFHSNVQMPWRDVNNCQEGLKQCFSIQGNCYELPKQEDE